MENQRVVYEGYRKDFIKELIIVTQEEGNTQQLREKGKYQDEEQGDKQPALQQDQACEVDTKSQELLDRMMKDPLGSFEPNPPPSLPPISPPHPPAAPKKKTSSFSVGSIGTSSELRGIIEQIDKDVYRTRPELNFFFSPLLPSHIAFNSTSSREVDPAFASSHESRRISTLSTSLIKQANAKDCWSSVMKHLWVDHTETSTDDLAVDEGPSPLISEVGSVERSEPAFLLGGWRPSPHYGASETDIARPRIHLDIMARILYIYARLNSGIQYVQGMNELLAPLYYVCFADSALSQLYLTQETDVDIALAGVDWGRVLSQCEADCFAIFSNLMERQRDLFCKALDSSQLGVNGRLHTIGEIIRRLDPAVAQRFDEQGIEVIFFALRWAMLLFSQDFELPDVIRLWDSIISMDFDTTTKHTDTAMGSARTSQNQTPRTSQHEDHRPPISAYLCVALILRIRNQLLAQDFAHNLKLLQNYPTVDINDLLVDAEHLRNIDTYDGTPGSRVVGAGKKFFSGAFEKIKAFGFQKKDGFTKRIDDLLKDDINRVAPMTAHRSFDDIDSHRSSSSINHAHIHRFDRALVNHIQQPQTMLDPLTMEPPSTPLDDLHVPKNQVTRSLGHFNDIPAAPVASVNIPLSSHPNSPNRERKHQSPAIGAEYPRSFHDNHFNQTSTHPSYSAPYYQHQYADSPNREHHLPGDDAVPSMSTGRSLYRQNDNVDFVAAQRVVVEGIDTAAEVAKAAASKIGSWFNRLTQGTVPSQPTDLGYVQSGGLVRSKVLDDAASELHTPNSRRPPSSSSFL